MYSTCFHSERFGSASSCRLQVYTHITDTAGCGSEHIKKSKEMLYQIQHTLNRCSISSSHSTLEKLRLSTVKKVNVFLVHAMRAYRGAETQLHPLLVLALDGEEFQ